MKFFSKLFNSVRRNEEDDTMIPYINTSSSSSSGTNRKSKVMTPKINSRDDDEKSIDSTNSNTQNQVDYSKLNLEDVFDFEDIEKMCKDAEDLNLIEYLTQEDIIHKLIDYIITTHTEIPQHLTYKLSELIDQEQEQYENSTTTLETTDTELLLYEQQKRQFKSEQRRRDSLTPTNEDDDDNDDNDDLKNQAVDVVGTAGAAPDANTEQRRTFLLNEILNEKYPRKATEILTSTIGTFHILPLIMMNQQQTQQQQQHGSSSNMLTSATGLNGGTTNGGQSTNSLARSNSMTLTSSTMTDSMSTPRSIYRNNMNSESIRRKLFSFIYQNKQQLNALLVKCFVRVIIAMMKIPHLTHLVMDYIYQPHELNIFTNCLPPSTSCTNILPSNSSNSSNPSSTTLVDPSQLSNPLESQNGTSTTIATSSSSSSYSTTHIILQMLNHIDTSDEISELLLMCLLYEDEDNDGTITAPSGNTINDSFITILNQLDEQQVNKNRDVLKLKQKIIQRLCCLQCEQSYSRSVTFILTTIIQYRKPVTKKPPTIVQYILNRKQMELIVGNTLLITSNSPSFVDNMNFIMNLILFIANNSTKLFNTGEVEMNSIDWKTVLVLIVENLVGFVALLGDGKAREILKQDSTIIYVEQYHPLQALLVDKKKNVRKRTVIAETSDGTTNVVEEPKINEEIISYPPLGIYRLKIIELFVILFKHIDILNSIYMTAKCGEETLSDIILNCDILSELIRLLFQYQSSLLHQMITRLLLDIIEGQMSPFFDALFLKYNLADKLLEIHEINQTLQKEQRNSLAISGFLTVLGQIIGEKQLTILQNNEKWMKFFQYTSDRSFIEKVYRVGNEQQQALPSGEEQRLDMLREYWDKNLM